MSRAFQVPGPATWLGIVAASLPLLVINGICMYYAQWRAVAIASGILAVMWGLWFVLLRVRGRRRQQGMYTPDDMI